MLDTLGAVPFVQIPSEINRSRISQAKMVGFSRLYCSILETTVGVATFGLEPPIIPVGRIEPASILETAAVGCVRNCDPPMS